jgi:hypothetical protein
MPSLSAMTVPILSSSDLVYEYRKEKEKEGRRFVLVGEALEPRFRGIYSSRSGVYCFRGAGSFLSNSASVTQTWIAELFPGRQCCSRDSDRWEVDF